MLTFLFFKTIIYLIIGIIIISILLGNSLRKIKNILKSDSFKEEIQKNKNINEIINKKLKYDFITKYLLLKIIKKIKIKAVQEEKEKIIKYCNVLEITIEEYNIYTKNDIKVKYKKLSKIYHPDLLTGNQEKMKELNEAKDYLMKILN